MVEPSFIDPTTGEYTQYFVSHSLGGTITGFRRKNARFMARELGLELEIEEAVAVYDAWADNADAADLAVENYEAKGDEEETFDDFLKDSIMIKDTATGDLLATVSILASDLPIITADIESSQPPGSLPRC